MANYIVASTNTISSLGEVIIYAGGKTSTTDIDSELIDISDLIYDYTKNEINYAAQMTVKLDNSGDKILTDYQNIKNQLWIIEVGGTEYFRGIPDKDSIIFNKSGGSNDVSVRIISKGFEFTDTTGLTSYDGTFALSDVIGRFVKESYLDAAVDIIDDKFYQESASEIYADPAYLEKGAATRDFFTVDGSSVSTDFLSEVMNTFGLKMAIWKGTVYFWAKDSYNGTYAASDSQEPTISTSRVLDATNDEYVEQSLVYVTRYLGDPPTGETTADEPLRLGRSGTIELVRASLNTITSPSGTRENNMWMWTTAGTTVVSSYTDYTTYSENNDIRVSHQLNLGATIAVYIWDNSEFNTFEIASADLGEALIDLATYLVSIYTKTSNTNFINTYGGAGTQVGRALPSLLIKTDGSDYVQLNADNSSNILDYVNEASGNGNITIGVGIGFEVYYDGSDTRLRCINPFENVSSYMSDSGAPDNTIVLSCPTEPLFDGTRIVSSFETTEDGIEEAILTTDPYTADNDKYVTNVDGGLEILYNIEERTDWQIAWDGAKTELRTTNALSFIPSDRVLVGSQVYVDCPTNSAFDGWYNVDAFTGGSDDATLNRDPYTTDTNNYPCNVKADPLIFDMQNIQFARKTEDIYESPQYGDEQTKFEVFDYSATALLNDTQRDQVLVEAIGDSADATAAKFGDATQDQIQIVIKDDSIEPYNRVTYDGNNYLIDRFSFSIKNGITKLSLGKE